MLIIKLCAFIAIGCNNIDNEGEREPSSHESLDGPSVDNAQVPVQETCDACGCTALASHVSQGRWSLYYIVINY